MKGLRKYIREEFKNLQRIHEVKVPLPFDAKNILFNYLNLKSSHIDNVQAIKSVTPSYRIYLNNGQSFTISDIGNGFGFGLVTIMGKKYDILDKRQTPQALKALNNLQTKPIM